MLVDKHSPRFENEAGYGGGGSEPFGTMQEPAEIPDGGPADDPTKPSIEDMMRENEILTEHARNATDCGPYQAPQAQAPRPVSKDLPWLFVVVYQ